LRFTIDAQVSEQVALAMNLAKTDLFNLTLRELGPNGQPVRSEQFRNLSVKDSARRIDKVLKAESKLVRWKGTWPPGTLPDVAAIHRGKGHLAPPKQQLAAAQAAPPPVPANITAAQSAVATAQQNLANITTDNISRAEQQLAAAKAQLAAAQKATPQVPA